MEKELKWLDFSTSVNHGNDAADPGVNVLFTMAQGDANGERVGKKILIKEIWLTGPSTGTAPTAYALVWDCGRFGRTGAQDFFKVYDNASNSLRNLNYGNRFQPICWKSDLNFAIPGGNNTVDDHIWSATNSGDIRMIINRCAEYGDAGTGDINDLNRGPVLIGYTNQVDPPAWVVHGRVVYTDA